MKRKWLVFLLDVLLGLFCLGCYSYMAYRQEMDNMPIVLRISSRGDIAGFDYSKEYLLIILPESQFHGERTINAIGLYLWFFNRREPDSLEMTFYDSQEDHKNHESNYSTSSAK